ncbi:MAG TPA: ATP-binding protein [Ignavibacteriaceae bacterium]|nr:ATP-binding protein [Ignavibacteriaceae bacterium]
MHIKDHIKSTRFKTTLWYSGLFLLLEVIIGITVFLYLKHSLEQDLNHSLSKQAEMIYNFVEESKVDLSSFTPDSIYSSSDELVYDLIFEAVALNPRNNFVQVELQNKMLFKTQNLVDQNIPFPDIPPDKIVIKNIQNDRLSDSPIRVAYLKKKNYEITVAYPSHLIDDTLAKLTDIYILIAPLFFVLSIIGGSVLSAGALSRIDEITRKTDEITTRNLNEKIPGEEFNDEYGRLVFTMNKMIQRIKTSLDYKNQFSMAASHELKTPLTILRGEVEVALRHPKSSEQYHDILKSNYEEILRLINIVDRLFFVSQFDNDQLRINKREVNLSSYLGRTLGSLEYLAGEKNNPLEYEAEKNIDVELDPDLMRQVLTNLVENAIKYGYENEPIKVTGCRSDNKIKIAVTNKGDGIPEEDIPRIFERFYRVESSRNRNTGGTGLGLSIVKSIIKLHNGEIFVKSVPGKETEFYFLLPIVN